MADNYVALKIKATDDAKPDLTDLKAKLEELQGKVATARANVDSADADATLTGLQANLDAVSKKVASPRIDMAGASRALAQLTAVDAAMGHLDGQSERTGGHLAALGGAVNTALLGIPTGIGEMTMFQKVLAGVNVATGIGEPAVAALTVAVGGLAAGVVPAVAGLGAFGLVAKENLTTASTATTAVQAAQTAYNSAIATGTSKATAYAAEQKAILTAYAQLSPAQVTLSKQIGNAENSWQSFVQSNTAGVSKILSQGIGLLPNVFSMLQPFMAPTEKALSGLVGDLSRAIAPAQHFSAALTETMRKAGEVASPAGAGGLRSMLADFAAQAGPDITKIGIALGHVAMGVLGVLHAFLPMSGSVLSGLDSLTAKFSAWGQTLGSHSGFQSLVTMAKQDGPLLETVLKNVAAAVKNLGGDMAGLSTFSNSRMLLQLAGPLSALLKAISGHPDLVNLALWGAVSFDGLKKAKTGLDGVKTGLDGLKAGKAALTNLAAGFNDAGKAASESTGAWGTAGGKIKGVFSGIRGSAEDAAAGEEAAAGEAAAANEEAAAESSSSWIAAAASAVAGWVASGARMVAQAAVWVAQNLAKVAVVVAENVAAAATTAAAWLAANAVMLLGIGAVVALVVVAVIEIVKHWKSIVHGVEEAWNAVYHAVSEAVSKVVGFVKTHWQLLLAILLGPIAVAVLEIAKHWDTIKKDASKFAADVVSTVSRLASDVLHWFGHMATSVVSTVARWYSDLTDWVRRLFDDFIALETRGIDNIIHWFEGLPGRIMGAIASLPGQLFSAGKNIIHMLAQGISSAIGDVTGAIGSVGSEILSHLPFSPAKKGPLSGSGSPDRSGRKIAQMVAQGLTAGTPDVQAAMERLAGSAGLSGRALAPAGGYGAYGAGGRQQLDITLTMGNNALLKAMQAEVRTAGGDPSMFQRKVAYR